MRCENVTDAQILEPIRHPSDNQGTDDIHTVEGAIRRNNTYRWYYGLGFCLAPERIGEIGVRMGYSLYAMALGASSSNKYAKPMLAGWDNQSYVKDSIEWANQHLAKVACSTRGVTVRHADTQKVTEQELSYSGWREFFDMFSVDGDHSQAGARHDLELAWICMRRGGVILVDDIDYPGQGNDINLRPVVETFCQEKATSFLYLPTTRGLAVITKV